MPNDNQLYDGLDYRETTAYHLKHKQQRFELIKAALTGLLANPNINAYPEYLARMAIRQADEVLAELDKNQT